MTEINPPPGVDLHTAAEGAKNKMSGGGDTGSDLFNPLKKSFVLCKVIMCVFCANCSEKLQ